MAIVRFNRKEFEKHVKLSDKVQEKINLLGTPLESLSPDEIEIEVFPNRPDLLSLHGYVRALKAFLGRDPGLKEYKVHKPLESYSVSVHPSVKQVRPFTVCAIVKNLVFDDERIKEIVDVQEKLHSTVGRNRKKVAIGVYPLEKISLPISFEARVPDKIKFKPLEADREMSGLQILQRHPTGKEYAHLLEDEKVFPVFVDARGKILSMPPIINSHETGKITDLTKEIFIECSGFHFETLHKTLIGFVTMLADMGGEVFQVSLDYGTEKLITPNLEPLKMKVSVDTINKMLGLNLKENEVARLLSLMGHGYKNKFVLIPPWRMDVLHEVDIVEDVAIAFGYDSLIPELPSVATIGEEVLAERIKRSIINLLVGLSFTQISTFHLIKQGEVALDEECIEVEDSKTDYKVLRPNLLIPALRIFSENKDHEYPQRVCEVGTVFSRDDTCETGVRETDHLLIAVSPGNFTEVKQILLYVGDSLGLSFSLERGSHPFLIEGRVASVLLHKKSIGRFGEVHPETLRSWGIKMPVAVLEISLEEIIAVLSKR